MKMRFLVVLLICLLLPAVVAFAAGKKEEVAETLEVAVLLPGSVEFFSVMQKGMDKAAADFDIKLIYADAEWDAGKQLSQLENFVTRDVDAILLCAGDNQALLPSIDICKDAGVPLLTFTNTLGSRPDGWVDGIVTFIGTNEVNMGKQLGIMGEKYVGDRPTNIVLIEGSPGTAPQRMRTQGFKMIVDEKPNWKIVYSQAIPGWTKEGSLAAMEAFLQTGERVDLVVTHWNAAAAAAAMALDEASYEGEVRIVGLEFNRDLVTFIKEGKVDAATFYSVEDLGYSVIDNTAQFLNGKTIPKFVEIETIVVDINNVDDIEPEF